MSLFLATLLTAIVLLLASSLLLWNGPPIGAMARQFPRSRRAAYVTMGLGTVWMLFRVAHLGEADFGNYRVVLFIAFALLAILVFRYVPDFLAVRGLCVLVLLTGDALLTAAYMRYDEPGRLFLVTLVYALIGISLYLAVSPFRMRDFLQWLFARANRARALGAIVGAYGLVLMIAVFTYA